MPGPNINPTYSQKKEYNETPDEILSYIRSQRGNTRQQGNQTSYTKSPQTGSGGLGTLEYNVPYTGRVNMPAVPNPDKIFGDIALNQYKQTQRDFLPFEQALLQTVDDTSLVDAVRPDVAKQTRISKEIAERNRQRYGYEQTAVEASESQRASQRGGALNLAGGLNTARLAQRERNRGLLADLINIGQDQNRSSLSMLGTAAENATMRANAFRQAQAQAKSQKISMIGSAMMTAAMFI